MIKRKQINPTEDGNHMLYKRMSFGVKGIYYKLFAQLQSLLVDQRTRKLYENIHTYIDLDGPND
jgi:hypothetical protein